MKALLATLLSVTLATSALLVNNSFIFTKNKEITEIDDVISLLHPYLSIIQLKKTATVIDVIKILELKIQFIKNVPEFNRNIAINIGQSGLDSFIKYFENGLIKSIQIDISLQHKIVPEVSIHIKNFVIEHILYIN